jgi:hypothetical protein
MRISTANSTAGPELVTAFLKRLEGFGLDEWNKKVEGADGTKTAEEKWFDGSEEQKEQLRKLLREKEKYTMPLLHQANANW